MHPQLKQSYQWFPAGMMGGGICGGTRPPWPEEEWARVDSLYRDVSTELHFKLYVLLTDQPAEQMAEALYIYLEPFASIFIALDHVRGEVSIVTDWWMWKIFESDFAELTNTAGSLLRSGRTIDALTLGLDRLRRLFHGDWHVDWHFIETGPGLESATITCRDEQGLHQWTVNR